MHPNISFSCLEQNSCGNKRSRRVAASATRGWHDDSLPGAGFLYNSVPLDSAGWHGDSPPEAGFSQSRRASPEAHQPRPNLPVSKCGFLLAFDKQTASSEPDTILRMKISKDVYVRYGSQPAQREHLWAPQTKCSPRVVHWPSRMSERGDFPPVAEQYLINSVALSSSSISSRCLLGSLPSEFLGPKHAAADWQPIVIGHFRLGSHDVVVERILDLLVVPLGVVQPLARAVSIFMQIRGTDLGETLMPRSSISNHLIHSSSTALLFWSFSSSQNFTECISPRSQFGLNVVHSLMNPLQADCSCINVAIIFIAICCSLWCSSCN